jgi:hypothetical protein
MWDLCKDIKEEKGLTRKEKEHLDKCNSYSKGLKSGIFEEKRP